MIAKIGKQKCNHKRGETQPGGPGQEFFEKDPDGQMKNVHGIRVFPYHGKELGNKERLCPGDTIVYEKSSPANGIEGIPNPLYRLISIMPIQVEKNAEENDEGKRCN
jgi:hypothetical protein